MKEKNHEETVFWEWYFHTFHMYIQYTDSVYQSRMCVCVCVCVIHLRTLTLASFCRQRTTPTSHFLHGNLRGIPQCHPPQAKSQPLLRDYMRTTCLSLRPAVSRRNSRGIYPKNLPMIAVLKATRGWRSTARPPQWSTRKSDRHRQPPHTCPDR